MESRAQRNTRLYKEYLDHEDIPRGVVEIRQDGRITKLVGTPFHDDVRLRPFFNKGWKCDNIYTLVLEKWSRDILAEVPQTIGEIVSEAISLLKEQGVLFRFPYTGREI